jgi:hypothetical protein
MISWLIHNQTRIDLAKVRTALATPAHPGSKVDEALLRIRDEEIAPLEDRWTTIKPLVLSVDSREGTVGKVLMAFAMGDIDESNVAEQTRKLAKTIGLNG